MQHSNNVPKMLANLVTQKKSISFVPCILQTFLYLAFAATECLILAAMSYDRFVAICHPLHYTVIMSWRVCTALAAASWGFSLFLDLVHLVLILRLPFCGPHEVNHFFCEILSVLKLACADTTLNQIVIFATCVFILVGPLCLVLVSYTRILVAILRIQSGEGRKKAFSTCSSHLCVVGLFFGSAIVMYMAPKSQHPEEQQKILSLFYSLFNPMLNPLIYSLRNAEVKGKDLDSKGDKEVFTCKSKSITPVRALPLDAPAIVDMSYASNNVPKMLANLMTKRRTISFIPCIMQTFLYLTFAHIECLILVVMSYDRFVAICHPLHYTVIMSWRVCTTLAAASWIFSFLLALVHIILILRLPFCGPNEINHFFCEILSVLQLACADTTLNQVVIFAACVFILVGPLCLVLVSYTRILVAILRIQSGEGRKKAFSTCSSHLCVVGLFFGSAIVMYMAPKSQHPEEQQKILSLFYSLFNPMLNPLIYSLRNAEVKGALRRALWKERPA
ncbi:hypothetical protein NN561_011918 [Cricetulus griseus]